MAAESNAAGPKAREIATQAFRDLQSAMQDTAVVFARQAQVAATLIGRLFGISRQLVSRQLRDSSAGEDSEGGASVADPWIDEKRGLRSVSPTTHP